MRRLILKNATRKSLAFKRFINVAASLPDTKHHHFEPEINVQRSKYEDIVIPEMTFDQYVWRNLHQWQDKTAIVSSYRI